MPRSKRQPALSRCTRKRSRTVSSTFSKGPRSSPYFAGTTDLSADTFRVDGKIALVTGALGVLGKTFCRGLAAHGASIAVVDLDKQECATFAKEIEAESGRRCVGIGCDVGGPSSGPAAGGAS